MRGRPSELERINAACLRSRAGLMRSELTGGTTRAIRRDIGSTVRRARARACMKSQHRGPHASSRDLAQEQRSTAMEA